MTTPNADDLPRTQFVTAPAVTTEEMRRAGARALGLDPWTYHGGGAALDCYTAMIAARPCAAPDAVKEIMRLHNECMNIQWYVGFAVGQERLADHLFAPRETARAALLEAVQRAVKP